MKRTFFRIGAVLLFAGAVGACGSAPQAGVEDVAAATAASAQGDFAAKVAEGDAHWENRSDEASTRAAIAAWEEAITYEVDGNRDEALYPVYSRLSRGWYWLAHGNLFQMEDRRQRETMQQNAYEKGMEYGQIALALNNTEWNAALNEGEDIQDAVRFITEDDIPAGYWWAANAGRYATLDGIGTLLSYKDRLFEMMTKLAELDDTYFYRATDRYFGVVYTKLPFMNPDLDQSREYFENAIEAHPEYLETRVLLAEEWATKSRERDLAVEHLEAVVAFDIDEVPAIRPENNRAQIRAQYILDNLDEFYR